MTSLFNELFKKFGGVFLDVFETIQGWIWGGCWRKHKGKLPRTNSENKIRKILLDIIKYYFKFLSIVYLTSRVYIFLQLTAAMALSTELLSADGASPVP